VENMRLLTVKDVAVVLKMNPNTVRKHVERGNLSYHKIGNSLRFSQNDVDEFLKSTHIRAREN